jgi:hypothetical protein
MRRILDAIGHALGWLMGLGVLGAWGYEQWRRRPK